MCDQFGIMSYDSQDKYSDGLTLAPDGHKIRAVLFANRAACNLELQQFQEAVKDCSSAIDIDGEYLKAWHRRSKAYEGLDDMDRALKDIQKVISLLYVALLYVAQEETCGIVIVCRLLQSCMGGMQHFQVWDPDCRQHYVPTSAILLCC